jgi:hypothetical protein
MKRIKSHVRLSHLDGAYALSCALKGHYEAPIREIGIQGDGLLEFDDGGFMLMLTRQ